MKRDPALHPLSRDHHQALFVARQLAQADEATARAAAESFRTFWKEHGRRHFRIEEEILLPAYAEYGDPENPAVVRVLVDHIAIRSQEARAEKADLSTDALQALGRRLEGHVRHEERSLFPLIESALPEARLVELGRAIERAEAEQLPEQWG